MPAKPIILPQESFATHQCAESKRGYVLSSSRKSRELIAWRTGAGTFFTGPPTYWMEILTSPTFRPAASRVRRYTTSCRTAP